MAKFKYKTQMYSSLYANIKNIYADAAAEAKKIGVPDVLAKLKEEGRGGFGLTGEMCIRDRHSAFLSREIPLAAALA